MSGWYRLRTWSCVVALVVGLPVPAIAQRFNRPEDQLLVSDFGDLVALAVGPQRVFAASTAGVIIYDYVQQRWDLPLGITAGYPRAERPTALAYDATGDVLWLGTASGALYSAPLTVRQWQSAGLTGGGPVVRLVSDDADGMLYIQTQGGWLSMQSGSLFTDPVSPGQLPARVLRQAALGSGNSGDPYLDAARGTLGVDARGRHWQLTDIAPAEEPGTYWVATAGGGLVRFDGRTMDRQWLRYGLASAGVGSIQADATGIWFGGDGRSQQRGVTRASADLETWQPLDAAYDRAPGGFVADITSTTGATWFAAEDGLFRLDLRGGVPGRFRRFTSNDGLPSNRATALAATGAALWVGTTKGLAVLPEGAGKAVPAGLLGESVYRLVASRDTLWIAAANGLWILPGATAAATALAGSTQGETAAIQPAPGTAGQPALRDQVIDILPVGDVMYALLPDAIFRYQGGRWQGPIREPAARGIGPLRRLAAAEDRLWVAGGRGVGLYDITANQWTYFLPPNDLPVGPAMDILPRGDFVWVATPAGALRLRWQP